MQNITDVDTFTDPAQAIADGDALNGANFLTMMQGAANRAAYLRKRIHGATVGDPIRFPLIVLPVTGASAGKWGWMAAGSAGALFQNDVTTNYPLYLELTHPKDVTLTTITAVLCGAAGHGALPSPMPKLWLYRQDPGSSGAPTLVGSMLDASASTGAYQVPHAVTISGLSENLTHDGGQRYFVKIDGEGNTNGVIGLGLLNLHGLISPT